MEKNDKLAVKTPPCGVVIEKKAGEEGVKCNEPSTYVVGIAASEEDPTIVCYVFLCDMHNESYDAGGTFLVEDSEGGRKIITTPPNVV